MLFTHQPLSQIILQWLPHSLGQLKQLSTLRVDQNHLCKVTEAIESCENLSEPVLTENMLMALPRSLGKLTKLTNIDTHWNRLEVLQPKVGVSVLSLRDNYLVILCGNLPTQLSCRCWVCLGTGCRDCCCGSPTSTSRLMAG